MVAIITHLVDVGGHTKDAARLHVQFVCFTIVFVSMGILKSLRTINKTIGKLIISLLNSIIPMLAWFIFYTLFWIPLSKYQLKY